MPNGAALLPDDMTGSQVKLYYHLDDFQNAIDLLKNESPLYLLYSGSGGGFENGIKITEEVIGEGEAEAQRQELREAEAQKKER